MLNIPFIRKGRKFHLVQSPSVTATIDQKQMYLISYYLQMQNFPSPIGVLRWVFELGRADITMEKYAPACITASPCEDHIKKYFTSFLFSKQSTIA